MKIKWSIAEEKTYYPDSGSAINYRSFTINDMEYRVDENYGAITHALLLILQSLEERG
jgi:hypothetical protein